MKTLRYLVALLGALVLLFTLPGAAFADTGAGGRTVVEIPDLYLTFLVATVLPILVGFVKARFAASWIGSLLLLFFSVVSGWLTSLNATGGEFEPKVAIVSIVMSFVTAVGAHYGLLKPMQVTGDNGVVLKAIPGGIGEPSNAGD